MPWRPAGWQRGGDGLGPNGQVSHRVCRGAVQTRSQEVSRLSMSAEQVAQGFTPAHADLPHSGGVAAQLASESYVEALARVVRYWGGYPGVGALAAGTYGRS